MCQPEMTLYFAYENDLLQKESGQGEVCQVETGKRRRVKKMWFEKSGGLLGVSFLSVSALPLVSCQPHSVGRAMVSSSDCP